MMEFLIEEFRSLINEGGWVLWGLLFLAFGIAWALIRILRDLLEPRRFVKAGRLGKAEAKEMGQLLFDPLDRRIRFAFVLIGAAPLLGLLGTVVGMLTTFSGLSQSVGTAPVDVISRGVSEALITTQTGLIIGVPSLIVCTVLKNHFEQLRLGFEELSAAAAQQ